MSESDNSLTHYLPAIVAVARSTCDGRGIEWLSVADDCVQEARAELLACRHQVPPDPAHARAKVRIIVRRATARWLDEILPTIKVPSSSAGRGHRLKRKTYWEPASVKREESGQPFYQPPQRKTARYWVAVERLARAAERLAAGIDPRLPAAVTAILDGRSVAEATRLAGLSRGRLADRLAWLGGQVAEQEPEETLVFLDAVQTASGNIWRNR